MKGDDVTLNLPKGMTSGAFLLAQFGNNDVVLRRRRPVTRVAIGYNRSLPSPSLRAVAAVRLSPR